MIVEVCVDSVQSATHAVLGGASRLELCANLGLGGGTTPSLGLLKAVQRAVPGIPIMAMVRPRTGDFLYSEQEFDVMLEDASIFVEHGVTGVVAGFLTPEGEIDVLKTARFANVAQPVEFCFHRAFDMTKDLEAAFEILAGIRGVHRILTSGGGKSAPQSLTILKTLLQTSQLLLKQENRTLTILPGSGIRDKTIGDILTLLPDGLREVHLSGGTWIDGEMQHRVDGMGMGVGGAGEWGIWMTQTERVRAVCAKILEAH